MTDSARLRTFLLASTLALGLTPLAPRAARALIIIEDGSSEVRIDETSNAGLFQWKTADGVNYVEKEWFWYRAGATVGEASIDSLTFNGGASDILGMDGNVTLVYDEPGGAFRIQIELTLVGNSPDGPDTLFEEIDIFNNTTSALDFRFYEYTDFDLDGDPDDEGNFPNAFTAFQEDASLPPPDSGDLISFLSTSAGLSPSQKAMVNDGSILTALDDGSDTNLNTINGNNISGNVSWAFQFDFVGANAINPNNSVGFSKTKMLAPEPGTAALSALGLLGLALFGRRR